MWLPTVNLEEARGPKYKALVEAIIGDIESGRLANGTRMPTHRDLAYRLGVSVQTVTAAYKEVERQGWLRSERRRGTFVQGRVTDRTPAIILDSRQPDLVDLSIVRTCFTDWHMGLSARAPQALSEAPSLSWMQSCRPVAGFERHRAAGIRLLSSFGLETSQRQLLVTNGAAHGLFLALATVTQPDDVVLVEELTDHGVIGCSSVLRFTLKGLPLDKEGLLPDAFEQACKQHKVKALVCTPTFNNPTMALMGMDRRSAIAAIARRHGVYVIEDDVYRPLLDRPDALPPITSALPELGFHVTSFTKSVMAGLRVGYLSVPHKLSLRAASVLRTTGWMATPMVAEIATAWLEDGTMAEAFDRQRAALRDRQALVGSILGDLVLNHHPTSPSAWVAVPPPWREDALAAELRNAGVAVATSDPFMARPMPRPGAVRVCVGGAPDLPALEQALTTLRTTLDQMPSVHAFEYV